MNNSQYLTIQKLLIIKIFCKEVLGINYCLEVYKVLMKFNYKIS